MYFLFNRTTLQVFVTYLTGALYVHPLWFYEHQHDNRVRSKLYVACQRWWFQWRFASNLLNWAPSGEMRNYCIPHIIKESFENFVIHRYNYILLSQVYCVWQVVKTPTIIFNNPVYSDSCVELQRSLKLLIFFFHSICDAAAPPGSWFPSDDAPSGRDLTPLITRICDASLRTSSHLVLPFPANFLNGIIYRFSKTNVYIIYLVL